MKVPMSWNRYRKQQWCISIPQLVVLCLCAVSISSSCAFSTPTVVTSSTRTSATYLKASSTLDGIMQVQAGQQEHPSIIPVTILSGFLGSGKTSLLQQLLQNKQGLRIGVVVNDVASVNIDSKLVKQRHPRAAQHIPNNGEDVDNETLSLSDGMVELQNGCACCSLSDELLSSVSELVTLSQLRDGSEKGGFQHIVVEMSGVADPKQVRAKFQEATLAGMPLMDYVRLDTMVTVVDASMFESYFASSKTASRKETPELFYMHGQGPQEVSHFEEEEEDWMKDMPPKLLEAVMAGLRGASMEYETNGVAELLVSQTETADVVVLNKCDLVESNTDIDRLKEVVSALNPRARIEQTTYGQVPLSAILAVANGEGVAISGAVDDHREYVAAAMQESTSTNMRDTEASDHSSHSHSHEQHDHQSAGTHSHSHDHRDDCSNPSCTDVSHSHEVEESITCSDPNCRVSSHGHVHSHSSNSGTSHAGIGTFVYRSRRPFHPNRMVAFLHNLPITRGLPESSEDDDAINGQLSLTADAKDTLQSTLRSKGFCWCADSHVNAMYWSHAGSSFELMCLGQWWATLPRDQWPEGIEDYVSQDFDNPAHEDAKSIGDSVGDRRQELVFIGPQFDKPEKQVQIQTALDQCLLTSDEYGAYRSMQSNDNELQIHFPNILESNYVNY